MNIHWEEVLTDPFGLAGYALFLVFAITATIVKKNKPADRWILPGGFILASICVLGALGIAYHRDLAASARTKNPKLPAQSLKIGQIDQKVRNGSAVAGVQGNVTANPAPGPEDTKH